MILLMHICIALMSIGAATLAFVKPSTKKLLTSYGFIVATVASGTYLLLTTPGDIMRSCLVGLVYVTMVSIVTIATHFRVRSLATSGYQAQDSTAQRRP